MSLPTDESDAVRFWSKVDHRAGSCWLWTGARDAKGYGKFWARGRDVGSHRWAYEHLVGPIPSGLGLDHLCRNPACVNPTHLEPVTDRINILRGNGLAAFNARKTECANGHPLSGDNLLPVSDGRACVTCRRASWREYQRRKALARKDPMVERQALANFLEKAR